MEGERAGRVLTVEKKIISRRYTKRGVQTPGADTQANPKDGGPAVGWTRPFVCLFVFHCDKMEFSAPQKRELGPEPPHFPLAEGEAAGCRYGSRHTVLAGGAGGRLTAE